eukprot:3023939-Pleurochrysis_carterae.AAC.1
MHYETALGRCLATPKIVDSAHVTADGYADTDAAIPTACPPSHTTRTPCLPSLPTRVRESRCRHSIVRAAAPTSAANRRSRSRGTR